MLIKEYRIPLPLSVEEYKIAQLYMIAVSNLKYKLYISNNDFIIYCLSYSCRK